MPAKRSHLQSPNPVKFQSLELDDQSLEADIEPSPAVSVPADLQSQNGSGAQPRGALQDVTASINVIDEAASEVTIEAPPSSPALVALPVLPLTPPRSAAGGNAVVSPLSPSTNISRFLHGSQPVRICCNLG